MGSLRKSLWALTMLGWLLGIHNGYIALWTESSKSPCIVYPYKAALLPPAEVSRLEEGISIHDRQHLEYLLMNYFS